MCMHMHKHYHVVNIIIMMFLHKSKLETMILFITNKAYIHNNIYAMNLVVLMIVNGDGRWQGEWTNGIRAI